MLMFQITFASDFVRLNDSSNKVDGFDIFYLKDKGDNLGYQDVKTKKFTDKVKNRFTLGYLNYPVWFKLSLYNDSDKENSYILTFEEPFFDYTTLYYEKHGVLFTSKNSVAIRVEDRELSYSSNHFKVALNPNEKIDLYIKARSYFSTFAEVFIYSERYYDVNFKKQYFLYLLYLGAIGTIAFYNLILFLYLKEKTYLYYFGYTLSFGFWMGLFSGILYFYIPIVYIYYLHSSAPFALIFFSLFSNNILEIKDRYHRTHRFLKYNLFFLIILFFWVPLDLFVGFQLVNFVSSYLFLIYFFLSLNEFRKGNRIAKYYLIAIGIFLISISLLSLMVIGVFPNTLITRYLFIMGSLIEIVMFSLLLALRIDLSQKSYQNRLEEEILKKTENINSQNLQLQQLLQDKETLLRELFHRVKNNFQILIAYLSSEESKEKDKYVKATIDQVIAKLKSMSIVHDMLYGYNSTKETDTKKYFEMLFSHLTLPNFKYSLMVDDLNVDGKTLKKLGLLVNELITNTIKHSGDEGPVEIRFSFCRIDANRVELQYQDTQQDLYQRSFQKGYGTVFIEELTTSFKNCFIEKGTNAFHYIITFEL